MENLDTSEVAESQLSDTDAIKRDVNKRRSSVFQRRSLNPHRKEYNESVCEAHRPTAAEVRQQKEQEDVDLNDYILQLKDERKAWKKELKERKSRRHNLERQLTRVSDGVELDHSLLTETERNFLLKRPDYQSTCEKVKVLADTAVKEAILNAEINHMYNTLMERLNENIQQTRNQLISSSNV